MKTAKRVLLLVLVCVIVALALAMTDSEYGDFADDEFCDDEFAVTEIYEPDDEYPGYILTHAPDCDTQLTLLYGGRFFAYDDPVIKPTDHLVAIDIFERKINGTHAQKLKLIEEQIAAGNSIKKSLEYCFPKINDTVSSAIAAVNKPPRDAEIDFNPRKTPAFEIKAEAQGRKVDELALYSKIYSALKNRPDPVINIDTVPLYPDITYADCVRAVNLRSRFTTDFSKSAAGRRHNIALALNKINGARLDAGEKFSFNKRVGPRSSAAGFQTAKIIMDGKFTEGLGGGVCQVSTTLYNAAIRADLAVTHAVGHSLPVSYVSPSFDAMVSSRCDLSFVNEGKMPVFIKCFAKGSTAVVEIYGTPLPYTIQPHSVVPGYVPPPPAEEIIDTSGAYTFGFMSGERAWVKSPKNGLKSEGYLNYYNHRGDLINRKRIRKDAYKGIRGVYAIAP